MQRILWIYHCRIACTQLLASEIPSSLALSLLRAEWRRINFVCRLQLRFIRSNDTEAGDATAAQLPTLNKRYIFQFTEQKRLTMKNESRKCLTIDSDKGQLESNDSPRASLKRMFLFWLRFSFSHPTPPKTARQTIAAGSSITFLLEE